MAKPTAPHPQSKSPAKVLILHTAFLGDIVLATSFLANLRAYLPQAEIRFLTTPAGAQVLQPNAFGVIPIVYDKRAKDRGFPAFLRMGRSLREWAPDLVFCLHRSLRSVMLARISGGETWGFADAAGSVLFDHRVKRPKRGFEAEKNHAIIQAWARDSARNASLFPQLMCAEKDQAEAQRLLEGVDRFVALAPSSVWATKRWPAPYFARVAELLWKKHRVRCVLVGGKDPADLEAAAVLLKSFSQEDSAPTPLDLTGKTSLGTLKSVLSRASLVIANDSAPLHIAIAVGAPVLGIFGPTTKDLGFFPLAPSGKSAVAEVQLSCRPCGMHGHDACPLGHFHCMLHLAPEQVFAEADKLLCR